MTIQQKERLMKQAVHLYNLGLKLKWWRDKLCCQLHKAFPSRSPEMIGSLLHFQEIQQEWQELEARRLKFRCFLTQGRCEA